MLSKNPRVILTFEREAVDVLNQIAKEEHISVSKLVRELTLEALEKREDLILSKLASKLDKPAVQIFTHGEAWK